MDAVLEMAISWIESGSSQATQSVWFKTYIDLYYAFVEVVTMREVSHSSVNAFTLEICAFQ